MQKAQICNKVSHSYCYIYYPPPPHSVGVISANQEVLAMDKSQYNLEETEWLPISISATLYEFRFWCTQIRPISCRIS